MRKVIIIAAAAIIGLASPAFATNPGNNGGGNGGCGVGQQTNGCGGAGGAGGAGGTGVGVGVGVGIANQSQNQGQVQGQSQTSRNTNNNRNSNRNNNTANGGNASSDARGGDQSQGQEVNNQGAGSNSNNYTAPSIPVSSATAPSFAIGSCQWAFSGGFQVFGAGVSAGSAGMYEFCKALMKSRHMQDGGKHDVAKALECQDSSIRAAYKSVGKPCIEDMPRQVAAVAPVQQTVVPVLASPPVSPCPNGIANQTTQRDGSQLITCN